MKQRKRRKEEGGRSGGCKEEKDGGKGEEKQRKGLEVEELHVGERSNERKAGGTKKEGN